MEYYYYYYLNSLLLLGTSEKTHLFTSLSIDHVKIYSMVRMRGLGFAKVEKSSSVIAVLFNCLCDVQNKRTGEGG